MEVEDIQMQIQSLLCQLGLKDLEGMAKTLGCSEGQKSEETGIANSVNTARPQFKIFR